MAATAPFKVGVYCNPVKSSPLAVIRCLDAWSIPFFSVSNDQFAAGVPGEASVLLMPGGWYAFRPEIRVAIRSFVEVGGGCIGICAGAYNLCGRSRMLHEKHDSLGLIEADTSFVRLTGKAGIEVRDGRHPILNHVKKACKRHGERKWEPIEIIYWNGPFMLPKYPRHLVASFDWEGRLGAILAAPFGKGRAVAFGPHPEMSEEQWPPSTDKPLWPCAGLLFNALYWSAGRRIPKRPDQ